MIASPALRNGTARAAFPREPLLLTSVQWPYAGPGYEGVTWHYSVPAVRALMDNDAAALTTLTEPYNAQEQAVVAAFNADKAALPADLSDADRAERVTALWTEAQSKVDALLLDWALAVIGRVVYRITWEYAEPPPGPADSAALQATGWDAQALLWLARDGLAEAGASFLGPLSQRMTPRTS